MKKKSKILITLIQIVLIAVIIFSGIKIIEWIKSNKKNKDIMSEIKENVVINNEMDSNNEEYKIDFAKLKQKNSDAIAWIKVNGTNINYPFVKHTDNDYYLNKSFDKSYNEAGWVFMDYRNNASNFDKNTILYAHGRLDGTMFSSLKNILKSSWYDNKDNHIIRLSTETENTLWQVFSVYRIPTTSDYIEVNFRSDTEYLNLLNTLKERSNFAFGTTISEKDKILTLSTCYNDDDKVVMHAKLIKQSKR